MKKYLLLFLFPVTTMGGDIFSQEIISLVEKDLDRDTFVNKKNVDINSQLVFKLNKTELLKKLNNSPDTSNLPSDVDKLLQVLTNALEKKKQWMDQFAQAVVSYEAGNKKQRDDFLNKASEISGEILAVIRSDQKLSDYVEEDTNTIWIQLTNAITRRVREVEQELFTSPKYGDVSVQMGGWLIHNNEKSPLHFDGLDTNPLGEFYEVERWRFTPTNEQLAELERLQQLVKEDELSEANLADVIRSEYISSFIDELKMRLQTSLNDFKTKAENIVAGIGAGAVKTDIQDLIAKSRTMIDLATERISFYSNLRNDPSFSITLLVNTFTNDISTFNKGQADIRRLLMKLRNDLEASTQAIRNIVANANLMIGDLVEELKMGFLEGFDVLAGNRINDLAFEFSEKILSLSLKDIPEAPATDLRYSGYREPGDKVLVKLVVTKGATRTLVYQETRDVTLYRILSHVETSVGVIFAHPLSETSIKKDFQMAPYYNALFKGILQGKNGKEKLRDKTLRNTIWQTSFGLHASTPDFDKDDVPELGFGIVLSTLNDYVQAGTAYNIFHGTPYVFFGVRLPIGNINLGRHQDPGVPGNGN